MKGILLIFLIFGILIFLLDFYSYDLDEKNIVLRPAVLKKDRLVSFSSESEIDSLIVFRNASPPKKIACLKNEPYCFLAKQKGVYSFIVYYKDEEIRGGYYFQIKE